MQDACKLHYVNTDIVKYM